MRERGAFIDNWFGEDVEKAHACWKLITHTPGMLELSRTPLLLAMTCIALAQNLRLSGVKTELYAEAISALLKQWDSSRYITREDRYRHLTPERREQLLRHIAAISFWNETFVFKEDQLGRLIESYLDKISPEQLDRQIGDGLAIVKVIEEQHGLLVERAKGIHSFSHLTLQEFFVAAFLVSAAPALLEGERSPARLTMLWRNWGSGEKSSPSCPASPMPSASHADRT